MGDFAIYVLYLSFCFRYLSHHFTIVLCLKKPLLDINDSNIYQKICCTFHKCELSPVCDVMRLFKKVFCENDLLQWLQTLFVHTYITHKWCLLNISNSFVHEWSSNYLFTIYILYLVCFRYKVYTTYETIKISSRLMGILKTWK